MTASSTATWTSPPPEGAEVRVADHRGACAWWTSGRFGGDPEIVDHALRAVACGLPVRIGDGVWRAGGDDPAEAIAALSAWDPGRTEVLQAPDAVLAELYEENLAWLG